MPVPYTTAIGSLARHCSERPREGEVRADERDLRPDRGHLALARCATSRCGASRWSTGRSRPSAEWKARDPAAARPRRRSAMLSWDDIEKAKAPSRGSPTARPCSARGSSTSTRAPQVFFKAENLQRGGAFKFRGAYNKMKAETERGKVDAVVAFSSGNHAQAVALVSSLLGHPRHGRHADRRAAGQDRRDARLRRRGRPLRPRDAEPGRPGRSRSAASGTPSSCRPTTTSSSWRARPRARSSCSRTCPISTPSSCASRAAG